MLRLLPAAVSAPPSEPVHAVHEAFRLVWDAPFPATLQDAAFRLVDVNPAYLEFTGHSRDWLIGRDPLELQPAEDRASSLEAREAFLANSALADTGPLFERRLLDAGGHERWYRAARRRVTDAQGRTLLLVVMQDSTAEHVARERADRSARELDNWFDLSPVGMVLFDDRGLLVRSNPAFEALVGSMPVTLPEAGLPLQELLCWDGDAPDARLRPGAPPLERQVWMPQPGGADLRLRSIVRCYKAPGGHRRHMAVVEDRSVEEERDLAQMQIGAMMDTAGVGLATFQESSGWVRQRQSGGGAGAPSALQAIGRDVVMPESLPEYERLQRALKLGERAEVRYAVRHPELGQRWLLTRVEPATLASGQRTTSVVTLDVTEQQQAQLRSEELLREMSNILESTVTGIAQLRGGLLVRCNQRFEAMVGLAAGGAAGRGLVDLFGGDPNVRHVAVEGLNTLGSGEVMETEFEFAPPGLPMLWYGLSVRRTDSGTGLGVARLDGVVDRPAQHGLGTAREGVLHLGDAAHARLHVRDVARHAGRRLGAVGTAIVGQVDDRVLEAGQHLAGQLRQRPALEQQRVAVGMQRDDGSGVRGVAGHEGRDLDHHVRRRLGLHQVLQQRFAGHVERHARTVGRPHAAHGMQQLRGVGRAVRLQREDGQARGRHRPVAVDEGRVAEGHLAEDRNVEHGGLTC